MNKLMSLKNPQNNNEQSIIIQQLTLENSELKEKIQYLEDKIKKLIQEKIQEKMKVDVDSSITRDKLLRSRDTDVSRHQLFILDRPIRKGLIPYLWVISVLFIGIGLVILKISLPSLGSDTLGTNTGGNSVLSILTEFITNKIVLGSLLTSALIVILFLSLKVAGVFGN